MTPNKLLLLAGGALLAAAPMMPIAGHAASAGRAMTVAQATNPAPDRKKEEEEKKKKEAPQHKPPPPPAQKPPAAAPPHVLPPTVQRPAPPKPVQSAPVHQPTPPHPAQVTPPRPAQVAPVRKPEPPKPAQAAPTHAPPPPTARKPPAPTVRQTAPAATQQKPPQSTQPLRQAGPERRDHRRDAQPQPKPAPTPAAPATTAKPAPTTTAPTATQPQKQAAPTTAAPAVTQAPTKPRNANEFIRRNNSQPQRTIQDVRRERSTTQQNGRVFIHEGDRTIVREQNRTIIRHNEDQRFAVGARNVRVSQRNGETISIIVRPDGITIISTTDRDGRLIRRVRRDRNGREFVIIDNRRPALGGLFLNLRPPHIRMPRDRYIIDAYDADEADIYDLLIAPPVEPIDGYYSLDQVRYNAALRDYMRRLDLDTHFDTGSWQITPPQMDRLSLVAKALRRAIRRNPREVFLIEGHTDAVGSEEDNLSLSDRRAEAVAVALTEAFGVPPENLVTQGYGEQELKVPTQGPSRINRRVAIRRITPLIDRTARR